MKKASVFLLILCLAASLLTGCNDVPIQSAHDTPVPASVVEQPSSPVQAPAGSGVILLDGDKVSSSVGGVSVNGTVITVSSSGEYTFQGALDEGQIVVNTGEDPGKVTLILDGVSLSCRSDAAIYVAQAHDVKIYLPDGSDNVISSGMDGAALDPNASGAAIYSEDDLIFEGSGSLKVIGNINNGIASKDDIDINGGTISVFALNNGIRASESVTVNGGDISITCGNDGIKTTSAVKDGKGYIEINGGNIAMETVGDGIAAETELRVLGGIVYVSTTGDPLVSSCKALKAKTGMSITGGYLNLTSTDHAVHSTAGIELSGGELLISSAAKGISAHTGIHIGGGTFNIVSSDDGIESKTAVIIDGGELVISSGNDGIKAGEKGTGFEPVSGQVSINGGTVGISASADGIDAKAVLEVNGGSVLALGIGDKIKSFTGGTQGFVSGTLVGAAGDTVSIKDASGSELFTMDAARNFNSLICSLPGMSSGSTYTAATVARSVSLTA